MIRRLKNQYPGPGGMFAVSFLLHVALFLLVVEGHLLPAPHKEETQVTYVDMVTLPVASPQSGTPAPSTAKEAAPAPASAAAPPAPSTPPPSEMALPEPKPKAKPTLKAKEAPSKAKAAQPSPTPSATESQAFNERMAKLERQAEDRRQADVLARLAARGRTGMPGGKGTQAGSDYSSYVQSRFKDALARTMAKETKSPLVIAMIRIGADGRIAEYRVLRSSGDQVFEESVTRAVTLAGKTLKPPPAGQFKYEFHFKPEEVVVK